MVEPEELGLLAKYPFIDEARAYVASSGYTLADLLEDPAYGRSRTRAAARVIDALEKGFVDDAEASVETDAGAEVELLSYPVARALVVQVGDPFLTSRYAVAEAARAWKWLKYGDAGTIKRVAAQLGLRFEDPVQEGDFVRVPFIQYLRTAPTRQDEWKLVNQPLDAGYVGLAPDTAVRLMEEALRDRLAEELAEVPKPGKPVERAFAEDLGRIRKLLAEHHARYKRDEIKDVRLEAFPPCMVQIWEGIKAHQNVPHQGRFAIVSFLHKLGMDSEKILDFFSAVPDFDPNKSRYQIQHITGEIGGSTDYTPPGCATMATYGICPLDDRDELCFKISHPLSYYRRRYRALPQKAEAKAAPAETADG